ncbi:2-hydroxyacid dehydrogenase [Anaerotalea alkaliphila]|uniref:2-hydroxyacid dehydrogenase n=1 Tax=Anaerotalea alkaliphila TaxID=2662126 RepID=A0A7X5HW03_9FIRM|nr:2-hydroxyacid dehydrogenase [Anaerotalea alkaliphila]NDL67680.1 2-hydroxyacid dehydrogenase [Anaerotalea alkaliphila]
MKILVLGDHFLKKEIVEQKLSDALKGFEQVEFIGMTSNWPMTPFAKNEEIAEYEGSEEVIISAIKEADAVVLHAAPISERVLAAAENLKLIGVVRGGPRNVNVDAATRRGIPVINTPGRNAVAVVEFTVGLILAELKNIARAHANMVQGDWRKEYYLYDQCKFELTDKTIGLVGFGNIAYRLSTILKAFGMRVVAYDPFVPDRQMEAYGVEPVGFEELLERSDIVSVHARLTQETKEMFNAAVFKQMKKSALFVNTARGGLVNYKDLADALDSGEIACAALDVYAEEPVDFDSPIMRCSNVTFTPHIAGATKDTVHYGLDLLSKDIVNFFKGEKIDNCLNPSVLRV